MKLYKEQMHYDVIIMISPWILWHHCSPDLDRKTSQSLTINIPIAWIIWDEQTHLRCHIDVSHWCDIMIWQCDFTLQHHNMTSHIYIKWHIITSHNVIMTSQCYSDSMVMSHDMTSHTCIIRHAITSHNDIKLWHHIKM